MAKQVDDEQTPLKDSETVEIEVDSKPRDHSHRRRILGIPVSVFAGSLYCCASMSMVRW